MPRRTIPKAPILPRMPVTFLQQETITTIRLCNSFVVCVPMRGALPGIASLWADGMRRPVSPAGCDMLPGRRTPVGANKETSHEEDYHCFVAVRAAEEIGRASC